MRNGVIRSCSILVCLFSTVFILFCCQAPVCICSSCSFCVSRIILVIVVLGYISPMFASCFTACPAIMAFTCVDYLTCVSLLLRILYFSIYSLCVSPLSSVSSPQSCFLLFMLLFLVLLVLSVWYFVVSCITFSFSLSFLCTF